MQTVVTTAHARVGLLGNPSDIYGGRGIGFAVRELGARVELEPARQTEHAGELLQAGWAALSAELTARGSDPKARPHGITFSTDVPLQSGLAGSSAILTAAVRAWCAWFELELAPERVAELVWSAEVNGLGIRAGALDRLVQAFEGLIVMDFSDPFVAASTTRLDPALLPQLFLAWNTLPGRSSGDVHAPVYERWKQGDQAITEAMLEAASLADRGRTALEQGDVATMRALVNRNFDLRASLFPIEARDREMIELGRSHGAATKLCGSGGSVLVIPEHEKAVAGARAAYEAAGFATLIPTVATAEGGLR